MAARILKSFGKVYPNIEFEVVTGDFLRPDRGWIVNGTVDCGFLRLPPVKALADLRPASGRIAGHRPLDHPYADRDPFPVSALAEEPFIQLEEGDDYEIMAAFDEMGIRPQREVHRPGGSDHPRHGVGGVGHQPAAGADGAPQPHAHQKVCHVPLHFYRTIGIGVKDKKALSNSTRLFVDYVRTWVAENGNT